jgi:hypothetical protein
MYLGLLFPIDDYRVYGSYSNTHNKIILITDSSGAETANTKDCMASLANAFVRAAQNPFQEIGKPLKSKRLENAVRDIVLKQNSLYQKQRP